MDPVITSCGHYYCSECVPRICVCGVSTTNAPPVSFECALEYLRVNPICGMVGEETMQPPNVDHFDATTTTHSRNSSAKITALLDLLITTRSTAPMDKTIVYTSFTRFFSLLIPFLDEHKFQFVKVQFFTFCCVCFSRFTEESTAMWLIFCDLLVSLIVGNFLSLLWFTHRCVVALIMSSITLIHCAPLVGWKHVYWRSGWGGKSVFVWWKVHGVVGEFEVCKRWIESLLCQSSRADGCVVEPCNW